MWPHGCWEKTVRRLYPVRTRSRMAQLSRPKKCKIALASDNRERGNTWPGATFQLVKPLTFCLPIDIYSCRNSLMIVAQPAHTSRNEEPRRRRPSANRLRSKWVCICLQRGHARVLLYVRASCVDCSGDPASQIPCSQSRLTPEDSRQLRP